MNIKKRGRSLHYNSVLMMEEACFHRAENPFTAVIKDSQIPLCSQMRSLEHRLLRWLSGVRSQVEMEVMAWVLQIPTLLSRSSGASPLFPEHPIGGTHVSATR